MVANLVATVSAAPLLVWGGFALVGWTSVAFTGVQAVLAATLPVSMRARRPNAAAHAPTSPTFTSGRGERTTRRPLPRHASRGAARGVHVASHVRRVVVIAAVLIGLTAYDEYFPLIARDHGVSAVTMPFLVGVAVVGQVDRYGTGRPHCPDGPRVMAARRSRPAALLISVGALVGPVQLLLGFVAIAFGYGLLNNAMIVAGARFQEVIKGPARATVTSVHGFATEIFALAVMTPFVRGFRSGRPVSVLVALLGIPIVAIAWCVASLVPTRLPPSRRRSATGQTVQTDSHDSGLD